MDAKNTTPAAFHAFICSKASRDPALQANTEKCHSLRDYSNLEQTLTLNCSRIIVGNLLLVCGHPKTGQQIRQTLAPKAWATSCLEVEVQG